MSYGIIYLLTSPSNKVYVGQTIYALEKRWKQHVYSSGHYGIGCRHLNAAIQKYGPESFEKQIVAEAESRESLDNLEKLWIIALRADNQEFGYNISPGGDSPMLGLHHSEETKNKISAIFKGRVNEKNPFYGKQHTQESRDKMTASHILRWAKVSEEDKQKIFVGENNPFFGKQHTEEAKEKIREANRKLKAWQSEVRRLWWKNKKEKEGLICPA